MADRELGGYEDPRFLHPVYRGSAETGPVRILRPSGACSAHTHWPPGTPAGDRFVCTVRGCPGAGDPDQPERTPGVQPERRTTSGRYECAPPEVVVAVGADERPAPRRRTRVTVAAADEDQYDLFGGGS